MAQGHEQPRGHQNHLPEGGYQSWSNCHSHVWAHLNQQCHTDPHSLGWMASCFHSTPQRDHMAAHLVARARNPSSVPTHSPEEKGFLSLKTHLEAHPLM